MSHPEISRNMERLAARLFESTDPRQANFLAALSARDSGKPVVINLLNDEEAPDISERPAWLPPWVRVVGADETPGKSTEHEAGNWYVLDLSSVFCATPLRTITNPIAPRALDLCASPGGKAAFLWRALQPAILVANEPLQARIKALISNIKRCHIDPCVVTKRDPARLATELPECFDVVLVDAPCSGQSLRVKGRPAPGAFHPSTVNMNVRRQRRILAEAAALLRPGGALVYATCTYAREENEGNLQWFLEKFPNFQAESVPLLSAYQSHLTDLPCYRLWPFQNEGAGGFTCLLRSTSHEADTETPHTLPHVEWSSMRGAQQLEVLYS